MDTETNWPLGWALIRGYLNTKRVLKGYRKSNNNFYIYFFCPCLWPWTFKYSTNKLVAKQFTISYSNLVWISAHAELLPRLGG